MTATALTLDQAKALEKAGGVFTSGTYPQGLSAQSTIADWQNTFPSLPREFVEDYMTFVNAHQLLKIWLS